MSRGNLFWLLLGVLAMPLSVLDAGEISLNGIHEDWPRWRGPRGDGSFDGPQLPAQWPKEGLRRVWRQPLGGGYGGVAVADGRVYVMDRPASETDANSTSDPADSQDLPVELERVLCFDAASGRKLWAFPYVAEYADLDYGTGPRTTPTIHAGCVYALGAVGHLHCLDAKTGRQRWQRHLRNDFEGRMPTWGYSASPVVLGGRLIVVTGSGQGASVVALDPLSGRELWRSLSDDATYATPVLATLAGQQQLIVWTPSHIRGLNPETGRSFWSVPYEVNLGVSIAMPIVHDDIVLVSGYWDGTRAVKIGPQPTDARLLWEDNRNLRGLMSQPLYDDACGYLLDKRFGITGFDWHTGQKLWDDGNRMTPRGRNPQVTLVRLKRDHRVMGLNSEGELVLARFRPSGYEELSRTKIIDATWAHPAYAGEFVFARSDSQLVCVSLVD